MINNNGSDGNDNDSDDEDNSGYDDDDANEVPRQPRSIYYCIAQQYST